MTRPAEADSELRQAPGGDALDLRAYWRLLVRRGWVVAAVFAAVVIGTLLVSLRMTKVYAAAATLIIDVSAPRVLNKDQFQDVVDSGAGSFWLTKEYYETQYKVITSRAVAQRVIERLSLSRDLRFLGLVGIKNKIDIEQELARHDPVTVLQERLTVVPVKDSRIVRIIVEDRDPKWAATIANGVADAYIAESLSVRSTMTQSASEWLEHQLGELETKLAKSSEDLFRFKRAHDIVSTSWEDRQSMVTQNLAAVNDALTKARVQRAWLESRKEQVDAVQRAIDLGSTDFDAFPIINQARTVQDLKIRFFDVVQECVDSKQRYLSEHPKVATCEARLATARNALLGEVKAILEASRGEYTEVVQTENKLERLLRRTKESAFDVNQYEREYLELKRAHDNNQRLYDLVLARLKETGVTGMLQLSNVRVLDRAESPARPVRPRTLRNLLIAVVLGLIGGVALAVLLETVDTTLSSREEIEEHLGVPLLGIVPSIEQGARDSERVLFVHANPHSAAAECLRSIRTNLLFMSPEKPLKTILVTSSSPGEGKTTIASALAEIMADAGNRTLLIDADMRRPRVHKVFGCPNDVGLSSLIVGSGALASACRTTDVANLSVLPCGPIPPNPTELLHTRAFSDLLQRAGAEFDRVIVDSPPAGVVADSVVISTQVDGTVLVIKAGETSRDAAARATRSVEDVNGRLLGSVLNSLDLADRRYGEYYQYYRYGYYGSDEPKATTT